MLAHSANCRNHKGTQRTSIKSTVVPNAMALILLPVLEREEHVVAWPNSSISCFLGLHFSTFLVVSLYTSFYVNNGFLKHYDDHAQIVICLHHNPAAVDCVTKTKDSLLT